MAVTCPQTQPGVVAAFAADLTMPSSTPRKNAAGEPAVSAAIYGGVLGPDHRGRFSSSRR